MKIFAAELIKKSDSEEQIVHGNVLDETEGKFFIKSVFL